VLSLVGTTLTVSDATISTSDITTNNASTSKHGFLPKLDNNATHYMDGTGAWSTPAGGGGGTSIPGHIQGLAVSRNSTTAIAVTAGVVMINGTSYTVSAGTFTSASTMKDLNGSTVTIGASKCYHVYVYNNSGTAEIRVQDFADGTWGGTPTYDATLDYWKSPSAKGANARRIGMFFTNATPAIYSFSNTHYGRIRTVFLNSDPGSLTLLSAGTAGSWAAVTISPYVAGDIDNYYIMVNMATTGVAGVDLSWDGGTSTHLQPRGTGDGTVFNQENILIRNSGTLHYQKASGTNVYLHLKAFSLTV
jgi:hypothetical protein